LRKSFALVALVMGVGAVLAVTAFGGQPANPGCFGNDRADTINTVFKNGGALGTAPGASEWGQIAGERAGNNGDINRAYKTSCGGDPAA
jgi:hypothetical protein